MKLKCLLAMLLLTFLSCSNTPAVEDKIDSLPHSEPGKTLIVYFSWSGHTQTVANIIHELIGCDMVEIEPEKTMISIWNAILITLYLNYDITENFQTQFQKNSDAILSLIETLRNVDIPMPKKA